MNTTPAKTKPILTPAQKLKKLLKSADFTHTLTREVDGVDTEIEIAVFGEYEGAEPDVGLSAGYSFHSAVLVSDGSDVKLTDSEIQDVSEVGCDNYCKKVEASYESGMDCRQDDFD
jgi:hypothetical protein